MKLSSQTSYTLDLTSHELHVLLAVINGGTVSVQDQPVLAHIRHALSMGVAQTLQAEHQRFFEPPLRASMPSASTDYPPKPDSAP